MDYTRICINCMHEKQSAQQICPHCGFNPATYKWSGSALEPYTILNGKYLIGRVLGAGGFGITYIAFDMSLERVRAIKEFFLQGSMYRNSSESTGVSVVNGSFPQEQMYKINREKFIQEARIIAQLDNLPGIVRVHELFNENDTSYMVLEYLEGQTLKQYVKSHGGKLDYKEVLEKVRPVIKSLQQLHERGIYHRDISPDNIMVMRDGSLKLFDFGGARVQNANNDNRSVMVMKKTGYTPVEQYVDGEQGPWTDEYAMAATIYYCICGVVPPESVTRTAGEDPLKRPRNLVPGVPAKVESALMKGLGVRKTDRYPNMVAFEEALYQDKKVNGGSTGGGNIYNGGSSSDGGGNGGSAGKKALIALLIMALLGGGGFAAWKLFGQGQKQSYEVTVKNGKNQSVVSSYNYETGSMVTVIAEDLSESGYSFEQWIGDTAKLGVEEEALKNDTLQFEMPAEAVTLTAEYVGLPYAMSFDVADPDIKISVEPDQDTYLVGEEIILHAEVTEGWDFDSWSSDNGAAVFGDIHSESTTFTVPVGGGAVSASKIQHAYTINVENGTVSDGTYDHTQGESVSIRANAAAEGQRFRAWTVEGTTEDILEDPYSEETTLTMPGADVTVRAEYEEKTYRLLLPEGVTILEGKPEADGGYHVGTQITVEAVIDGGNEYKFSTWEVLGDGKIGDVDLTQNPLTFAMPASDLSLIAKTTENKVYISAIGVIGFDQPQAFHPGDEITLEADVDAHLEMGEAFSHWDIREGNMEPGGAEAASETAVGEAGAAEDTPWILTYTVPDGVEDTIIIEAVFEKIDYTLTVFFEDNEPQTQQHHMGDMVEWTAALYAEQEDARFTGWSVDAGTVDASYSGDAQETIRFEMPNEDVTLTAQYEAAEHTLTVMTLEGTEAFSYHKGDQVSYTAASIVDGMQFTNWNVTGGTLALDETAAKQLELSFVMPAEDVTVEAAYTEVQYVVTVTYDIDGSQSEYGYHKGDDAVIEVPAAYEEGDYVFDAWSVESGEAELADPQDNTAHFTMPDGNVELTAHYKKATHTLIRRFQGLDQSDEYEAGSQVSFGTQETFNGMQFICWTVEEGDITLEDPANTQISLVMPASDVILEAHYGYAVTVQNGVIAEAEGNYRGSVGDSRVYLESGNRVGIRPEIPEGYIFGGWNWLQVPDGFAAPAGDTETVSFTMPEGDLQVQAVLADDPSVPKAVETGYYFIAAAADTDLYVTADNPFLDYGTTLSMQEAAGEEQRYTTQLFYFETEDQENYIIKKVRGKGEPMDLSLDVLGAGTEEWTTVDLYGYHGGNEQTWHITSTGDEGRTWYYIRSGFDTYLSAGNGAQPGVPVVMNSKAKAGLQQRWVLIPCSEEEIPKITRYHFWVDGGQIVGTNGSEGGTYQAGETVTVIADTAMEFQKFGRWKGEDLSAEFANADPWTGQVTFPMPAHDLVISAETMESPEGIAVVPEGTYVFTPADETWKLLRGFGEENQLQTGISDFNGDNYENALFYVSYAGDGYYRIIQNSTGLFLTCGDKNADGTLSVSLAEGSESAKQQWHFETTGDGHYRITSAADNSDDRYCLGGSQGSTELGTMLVLSPEKDNRANFWHMYLDGYYDINPTNSGNVIRSGNYKIAAAEDTSLLLTVEAGVHEPLTMLMLQTEIEDQSERWAHQYFHIEGLEGGGYKISPAIDWPADGENPEDKITLDVNGGVIADGAAIDLYNSHGGIGQQWWLYSTGDLGSKLVFIGTGLDFGEDNTDQSKHCITAEDGIAEGTIAKLYPFDASSIQKWKIIP